MAVSNASCIIELNREWALLAPGTVPDHWAVPGGTLAELLSSIEADPDPVLGELLARYAEGEQLAGRVVLQAMLGKLVILAARDHQHSVADYLAECWLLLGHYPLIRRPRRIAANLALDTRRAVRAGDCDLPLIDPARIDDHPGPEAGDVGALIRTATKLGLIDAASAACLAATYLVGLPSHEAGRWLAISPALVRWRNARSLRALAPHAHLLAAAA